MLRTRKSLRFVHHYHRLDDGVAPCNSALPKRTDLHIAKFYQAASDHNKEPTLFSVKSYPCELGSNGMTMAIALSEDETRYI